MSIRKPRVFVAIKDSVRAGADYPTIVGMLVRLTQGFFSKAQLASFEGGYPWHPYEVTEESQAVATEPVSTGTYWVVNIDEDEAGMVGVIEQLADRTFAQVTAIDFDDVEFGLARDTDRMLSRVFGITPVPVEEEEPA